MFCLTPFAFLLHLWICWIFLLYIYIHYFLFIENNSEETQYCVLCLNVSRQFNIKSLLDRIVSAIGCFFLFYFWDKGKFLNKIFLFLFNSSFEFGCKLFVISFSEFSKQVKIFRLVFFAVFWKLNLLEFSEKLNAAK